MVKKYTPLEAEVIESRLKST